MGLKNKASSIEQQARLAAKLKAGTLETLPKPARCRRFVVANQKGGVGKTTTVVNLAAAMAHLGWKTLVVDFDPQGNATSALGVEKHPEKNSYWLLYHEGDPQDMVQQSPHHPNLFCIASTADLTGAESEMADEPGGQFRLREKLSDEWLAEHGYDAVLIDSPPSLGTIVLNALIAAREILIPIQTEYYALEGLSQLLETIKGVRGAFTAELCLSAIIMTMYDRRNNLAQDVVADVEQQLGAVVLDTPIPRTVRLAEAPSFSRTIFEHEPGGPGSVAYYFCAKELMERGESRPLNGTLIGQPHPTA